jgi:hypothetical protein
MSVSISRKRQRCGVPIPGAINGHLSPAINQLRKKGQWAVLAKKGQFALYKGQNFTPFRGANCFPLSFKTFKTLYLAPWWSWYHKTLSTCTPFSCYKETRGSSLGCTPSLYAHMHSPVQFNWFIKGRVLCELLVIHAPRTPLGIIRKE